MEWKLQNDLLAIRLDPGDDLLQSIAQAVVGSGFGPGFIVSCIGALKQAQFTSIVSCDGVAQYAPMKSAQGAIEMLVASGNVEPKENGGWKIHLHAMLCIEDQEFTGGHMNDTGNVVGVTAEVLLVKFPGMTRQAPKGPVAPLKFN